MNLGKLLQALELCCMFLQTLTLGLLGDKLMVLFILWQGRPIL
jgi:hypothetical protein